MENRRLGGAFPISALTLGGGGIGGVWGTTDADEAAATVAEAMDAGINFIDLAPLYRAAEERVGAVLGDRAEDDIRVSTKCLLGKVEPGTVATLLEASLDASSKAIGRDFIDLFVLHGVVIGDGWTGGPAAQHLDRMATPWSIYVEEVVPAMTSLVSAGRIGFWGVTTGPVIHDILAHPELPDAIQAVTNLLHSPGSMRVTGQEDQASTRRVISDASERGVGVMGIRAVAAGALCDELDRDVAPNSPEAMEFAGSAGFRRLAAEWGTTAAALAHRYALSMRGVDTVVLGVKNRQELRECLEAEALPRLTPGEMTTIEESANQER